MMCVKAATEVAFTGEYTDTETIGVYKCKACAAELFRSISQVPLWLRLAIFYAPTENDAVELLEDRSMFHEFEPRFDAQHAAHTLAMYLRARAYCGSNR
jgi:peptide methionine sulfoxide reductase MsrB